jgi:hypothetical protein
MAKSNPLYIYDCKYIYFFKKACISYIAPAKFINGLKEFFLIQFEEILFPLDFMPRFLTIIILVIVNNNETTRISSLFYLLPCNLMCNWKCLKF